MLFYILLRLGSVRRGLERYSTRIYISARLGSILRGLECCPISQHALTVSTEAWNEIIHLVTPWQYQWTSRTTSLRSALDNSMTILVLDSTLRIVKRNLIT